MNILTIDTSGCACQIGLVQGRDDSVHLLAELAVNHKNIHSEKIITFIDTVIQESRMDRKALNGIALSIGPGSFTGLRIGLSTAKGLAFALDIPLISVPTLDVIAEPFHVFAPAVCAAIQSRKGEFYTAFYEGGRRTSGPEVMAADVLTEKLNRPLIFICDSVHYLHNEIPAEYKKALIFPEFHHAKPDLYYLGLLGYRKYLNHEIEDLDQLVPLYIQPFLGKKP